MKKTNTLLALPIVLLPYLVLFTLATIFFSTSYSFFVYIVETLCHNNIFILIVVLLVYCILTTVLSIVWFIVSLCQKWDALSLAKSAMIMKLIQLPAYICIFILGVLLFITIFTFAFSIGLFLIDCLTLFLTGLITTASVINAVRQGDFEFKEVIWVLILQFVFCADVIASIIFYLKLKKKNTIKTDLV